MTAPTQPYAPGPPPGQPPAAPRRSGWRRFLDRADRWSEWTRSWLITLTVGCCALIFIAIWATYAATHTTTRYEQAAPGASATVDDRTFRVTQLRQTEMIMDGEEAVPSDAHTVWMVADVEVRVPRKMQTVGCDLPLVAVGDRTWRPETFYSRELPNYCDSEEIAPNTPYRVELIYQVPTKYADQVYGIAVLDPASAAPAKVLRPAT